MSEWVLKRFPYLAVTLVVSHGIRRPDGGAHIFFGEDGTAS